MMGMFDGVLARVREFMPNRQAATGVTSSESGRRPTAESSLHYQYREMLVDPDLRATILDIRQMDRRDGRVKRIHNRVARDTVRGGLVFTSSESSNRNLSRKWEEFCARLQLSRFEKLKSDARGLIMEGNLPLQFVLDDQFQVQSAIRMPAESIVPNVDEGGRFKDVSRAYRQLDAFSGELLAEFPLWKLLLLRLDPDNFDDMGALGRPFLDASRSVWRKLGMTEEDMVIRRRQRAALRLSHVLEGADKTTLDAYRAEVEADKGQITTDFYANKKGGVTAVQGDANLGEIADVVHLLDTFFAGSPMPKALLGYSEGLSRDILADLMAGYFQEIDEIQDTLAFGYEQAFRLQLLLEGIVPGPDEFSVSFAERRTETPNQLADRALKWRALGVPQVMIDQEMGFNPEKVNKLREQAASQSDPYPAGPGSIGLPSASPASSPTVKITPGNQRRGESGTAISNG